ncbi:proline-rich transmembrane protein 1-like [Clytia hemisphaerica]|uniref:Uncharacterized protein n=1 Tax=Clytia hemisphaerica TaxID=252671 RepID=A0A7M5XHP8_9CNID
MEQQKQTEAPPAYQEGQWDSEQQTRGSGDASLKGYPLPPTAQHQQPTSYGNQPPMYYQQTPCQQQPGYVYGAPPPPPGTVYMAPQQVVMEPPPPDWALLSWFTCLCCCWPIGLIAVIKSLDVGSAIRSGDMVRAKESSESAKKFAYLAFACGIFFSLLWLILWIIFADQIHSHRRHFHF